ncbi:hypothetical protein [Nostoc linckia]|nr:hypothetical protein [Nostoc linckia]
MGGWGDREVWGERFLPYPPTPPTPPTLPACPMPHPQCPNSYIFTSIE